MWDVDCVLEYFCSLPPTEKLSLKQLTLRTAMLLALFTGQRGHALHSLKFSDIHMSSNKCSLHFSSKRKHAWPAEILSFEQDRKLCFVDYLHVYIENTATLRSGHELFFSFHKPYACFTLLSRWLALKQPSPQRGEQWPLRIVHNACRELLCSSQRKVEPDRCSEGGRMHVTKYIHSVLQQDLRGKFNFGQSMRDGFLANVKMFVVNKWVPGTQMY